MYIVRLILIHSNHMVIIWLKFIILTKKKKQVHVCLSNNVEPNGFMEIIILGYGYNFIIFISDQESGTLTTYLPKLIKMSFYDLENEFKLNILLCWDSKKKQKLIHKNNLSNWSTDQTSEVVGTIMSLKETLVTWIWMLSETPFPSQSDLVNKAWSISFPTNEVILRLLNELCSAKNTIFSILAFTITCGKVNQYNQCLNINHLVYNFYRVYNHNP